MLLDLLLASLRMGKYDTAAVQGKNLVLTLDWELQAYGEQLMQNKLGSIVAIEPSTGEILAMISAPDYDPNLLVGRHLSKNYSALQGDTLLPLYNRAISSKNPPGSTFKTIMALAGMQEQVITESASFVCNKSLSGCHNHPTARNVSDGVKMSCNPYFISLTRRIIQQGKVSSIFKDAALGLDIWAKHVRSFGIGEDLHTDLPSVVRGKVPDTDYYNNEFPSKRNPYGEYRWAFSTIYSNSIGQGEVLVTPLEMANIAAAIANRGHYYYPHLIKEIEGDYIPDYYTQPVYTTIDTGYFRPVIDGMWRVVHEAGGTARRARIDSIEVCGKTGTAENFKMVHGKRVQMTDHSIFMAFAPKDNPKIAISVYVENSGFGGTWAAPIASLMIEKFINGEVKDKKKETRVMEANLIPTEADFLKK
jgi:penicillin-binding protein 2